MGKRYRYTSRTAAAVVMLMVLTRAVEAQSTDRGSTTRTDWVGARSSVPRCLRSQRPLGLWNASIARSPVRKRRDPLQHVVPGCGVGAHNDNVGRLLHGDHSAVSRVLIDPTYTHHAILEDELRVNFFSRADGTATARNVMSLELAYAFTDAFGVEVIVPYSLPGNTVNGGEILDIEAQPLKVSFLRRRNLIMTAVAGVVIPVGRLAAGEERTWRFEPHFFTDAAVGPFALQGNVIGSIGQDGEHELEVLASVARMIFFGEYNSVGPLLETVWEIPLAGEPAARVEPFLAPGIKLQLGGWYFGASYLFPMRVGSDTPSELALTAGYHVSFNRRDRPGNTQMSARRISRP